MTSDHRTGEPSISGRRRVEKKLSGTRFPQSVNDKGNVWAKALLQGQHSFVFQINPNIPIMSLRQRHSRSHADIGRRPTQGHSGALPEDFHCKASLPHKTDPPSCERCFMDNDNETGRYQRVHTVVVTGLKLSVEMKPSRSRPATHFLSIL
ncbi:hypothetical protein CEXT_297101 [Caerostris extrusa]|uniref:Uncharacterized protein n=1 Tax=Caerostris extrusa TaxID=172846 RepID=A0AAV4MEG6_CAEEX|nr:hypothetical protein CEXT_297101 [Caerostris extrusa]